MATAVDGHPENAAASRWGGLVVAGVDDGTAPRSRARSRSTTSGASSSSCPTRSSRLPTRARVLPASVPFADAVSNLNAMGLLIAGLADHQAFVTAPWTTASTSPTARRCSPSATPLLATLLDAGAAGSCWSGAGSSMLALCVGVAATTSADAAPVVPHGQCRSPVTSSPSRPTAWAWSRFEPRGGHPAPGAGRRRIRPARRGAHPVVGRTRQAGLRRGRPLGRRARGASCSGAIVLVVLHAPAPSPVERARSGSARWRSASRPRS